MIAAPNTGDKSPADGRRAEVGRESGETAISVTLNVDGLGKVDVATGFGMLDHMLTLTFFWAGMDLHLRCRGDLEVDAHHTVEDTAIVLGEALRQALGDRAGIARVGHGRVPMDEALADVTIDISGRPYLVWMGDELLPPVMAREEKDVWREWYRAFSAGARMNLHVSFLYGKNGHHLLESAAKGLGLALAEATAVRGTAVRSTKGGLD